MPYAILMVLCTIVDESTMVDIHIQKYQSLELVKYVMLTGSACQADTIRQFDSGMQ